jgi:hypothetical protein
MEHITGTGYEREGNEVEWLRSRVEELERENVENARRANEAIAAAQERAYWLDRWHLDLNALMQRRGASEFRAVVRAVRSALRAVKRIRRALTERRGK